MKPRTMVIEVIDDEMAEVLRRRTGAQRLATVNALFRSAWRLIETNVRSAHSDWTDDRVKAAVAARMAGGTD